MKNQELSTEQVRNLLQLYESLERIDVLQKKIKSLPNNVNSNLEGERWNKASEKEKLNCIKEIIISNQNVQDELKKQLVLLIGTIYKVLQAYELLLTRGKNDYLFEEEE